MNKSVVVLGGGLSGCSAAYALARAGLRVCVVERAPALGGLAGSFEREGRFYPLGYHHILPRDHTLLYFLELIGALEQVHWRRIRMFFRVGGQLYDLANPMDLLRFPMSVVDKARFAVLMLRAFRKKDWSDWVDKSAKDLLDCWAGPGVRHALFEPLTQLKFELPCSEVSGAWLGSRLHHREGSAAFGYIPGTNWTQVLCAGMARLLDESGVEVRLRTSVAKLQTNGDYVHEVELETGERIPADLVVSSIPTSIYLGLAPDDATPHLRKIRYSALLSMVCASKKAIEPDFYWMNLADLDRAACGIFLLNSLNPTIGIPGDSCVNFVTHLNNRTRPFFAKPEDQILDAYLADFNTVFGFDLDPFWFKCRACRCTRRSSRPVTETRPCVAHGSPTFTSPATTAPFPRSSRRARPSHPASRRPRLYCATAAPTRRYRRGRRLPQLEPCTHGRSQGVLADKGLARPRRAPSRPVGVPGGRAGRSAGQLAHAGHQGLTEGGVIASGGQGRSSHSPGGGIHAVHSAA
jgi:protoporphyrinogen oxidase